MAEKFSLKDHLFNPESVAQLAEEYTVIAGFDPNAFQIRALDGLDGRGLLERLEWLADCLEPYLANDFPTMADQLEAAMPAQLDGSRQDDDFGRFIHALPGILAVRHGLEQHCDRALDLIHAATQRFSMEFYIRPFINRWPDKTLARLAVWAGDENYHVRRLVSEGTRPRLPWAKAVSLSPEQVWPLLDRLYRDPTRYVTRSVANHLNDLSKTVPDQVLARLSSWRAEGGQTAKEMDWITRHALRTLIKQGHPAAMELLGYRADVEVRAKVTVASASFRIGEVLTFECDLTTPEDARLLVDYRISFARPNGKASQKVFKLAATKSKAGETLHLTRKHRLKGDATTFRLHPGPHLITLQVNGTDVAEAAFELTR